MSLASSPLARLHATVSAGLTPPPRRRAARLVLPHGSDGRPRRRVGVPARTDHPSDIAKAVAILLALPPVLGDLSHNNVNIFVLFLLAGCLEAFRRGRDVTAGLVLALAVACKVTPVLFVGYFAWKRAGRVLAGCAVGLALWL